MHTDDDFDEIEIDTLLKIFRAEVGESLPRMVEALLALERQPDDEERVDVVFRVVHSLKSNAKGFGFTGLTEFAHDVEEVLARLRQRTLSVSPELVTLLLRVTDALARMAEDPAAGSTEIAPPERELLEELAEIAGVEPASAREAEETAAGELDESPEERTRTEPGPAASPSQQAGTLRVARDKLDRLLSLTGEIAVARGRISQMLQDREQSRARILETVEETDFLFTELQELVTEARMVPVGPTFRRLIRTVRDLAETRGKLARLVLEDEDVEVDTSVMEHLSDPLTHMIRNAVDHGIEEPAVRVAAGKDPVGTVTLRARHDGGMIVVELADDGAGIDRRQVLRRARAMGLVKAEELSDHELHRLIFEPGFSTAEAVTDLSGRGVGMDVVRRNVEVLRGSVHVTSEAGQGTTVSLRLPLTLAVIEGFHVGVAGETYIVPMDAVLETLTLDGDTGSNGDGRGVINLRGAFLPWVRLRNLLQLGGEPPAREGVLVVSFEGSPAGLAVDALYGEGQTVIQPLAKPFRGLQGISGSAILGNGRVALILDVARLLRKELEPEMSRAPGS